MVFLRREEGLTEWPSATCASMVTIARPRYEHFEKERATLQVPQNETNENLRRIVHQLHKASEGTGPFKCSLAHLNGAFPMGSGHQLWYRHLERLGNEAEQRRASGRVKRVVLPSAQNDRQMLVAPSRHNCPSVMPRSSGVAGARRLGGHRDANTYAAASWLAQG